MLAFGANMSSRKLFERGVTCSEPGLPGKAPGFRVSFSHRGGFATLLELDGTKRNGHSMPQKSFSSQSRPLEYTCHGVMYSLTEGGMRQLAKRETGYRRTQGIAVMSSDGRWHKAEAFVSQPSLVLKAPVAPTERYLGLMREGAREHGLDQDYLSWLDGVEAWDGVSEHDSRYHTPSAAYANIGLACTFGLCVVLSLVFLR